MTRCLNCGADRNADVCEACGLGSTAAEFSLRSKLLNRTALFLLGAIAFVAATGRYPALDALSVRCEAMPEFQATNPGEWRVPKGG